MNTTLVSAWLLTYLAHSTILLGAALLVVRWLGERRLSAQETLLRMALLGGLLTATLQIGLGVEPIGGTLEITGSLRPPMPTGIEGAVSGASAAGQSVAPGRSAAWPAAELWPRVVVGMWAVGSLLALAGLGRAVLDLRRLLGTRRMRPTGQLLGRLATTMGLRRRVRLSTSRAIAVPFATGVRRPEICCPERIVDLAEDHQKSLFAHELAHLARRDPAWQILYRLGEALLFLQPLNRLVRRRLEDIAEHLTDDRAVACTGDRLGLARCLVVVAHWGIANAPGLPAAAFAAGPHLERRIHRLISGNGSQLRAARWAAPLVAASIVASIALLPAITPSAAHADNSANDAQITWTRTSSDSQTDATEPAPRHPPSPAPETVSPLPSPSAADTVPAPEAAPRPSVPPLPRTVPATGALAAPEARPAAPLAPSPPAAPAPAEETNAPQNKPSTREPGERAPEMERKEAAASARARERESRAVRDESRALAREAAEQARLGAAEREALRRQVRELARQAEVGGRRRATEQERRLDAAERREIERRAAELTAEARQRAHESERQARERSRELAARARQLAEEAEAARRAESAQRRFQEDE